MQKKAAEILKRAGLDSGAAPVWVVGGAVRDALLGRAFHDIDVVVPQGAQKFSQQWARRCGAKSFALDAERNIYRFAFEHEGEAWTFDVSDFEGKSLEADLTRRDFTINALAVPTASFAANKNWTQDIIDLFDGRNDLARRRVRLTHPRVIAADLLRLLRGFRMQAELGFQMDAATWAALKKQRKSIHRPAKERVREEILKILSTENAGKTFKAIDQAGLLTEIFPEGEPMRKTAQDFYGKGGVWRHSLEALSSLDQLLTEVRALFPRFQKPLQEYLDAPKSGFPRYAHLKLAVLFHDVGKPATETRDGDGQIHFYGHDDVGGKMAAKMAARLRCSTDEVRSLSLLVRAHMRPGNLAHQPALTDRAIYRFYRDLGDEAVGMLIVSLADHFTYLSEKARKGRKDIVYLTVVKMLTRYFLQREAVLPPKIVDGNVIMRKLKLKAGPVIGKILEAVREAQSEGKLKTQSEAVDFAGAWVKKFGAGDGNRTHV